MADKLVYPTPEKVIEYNALAIEIIKVKKADKSEVLSYKKVLDILKECNELNGDVYDKAVFLLREIVRKHPFASGNRRTAFIVTKEFLITNNAQFKVKDDPKYAEVMRGIREGYYTDEEIKEWIKNGQIKEFKR